MGSRNKVAEIMLTEARPLGFEGDTLIIGHNTGALAERLNAESNNADIVAVFSEKLGTQVPVRCVVGTETVVAKVRSSEREPSDDAEDPAPAPAAAPAPKDWRAAAAAASQQAAAKAKRERDEIPPPPEPAEEEPPYDPWENEPQPATYTQEDEERDMADQAQGEEGSPDRRDATEVAMELLATELGARPL